MLWAFWRVLQAIPEQFFCGVAGAGPLLTGECSAFFGVVPAELAAP